MKKHNCEKYRHTEMKYNRLIDVETNSQQLDWENLILVSYCSMCGEIIRKINVISK